jgi:hypothetical protein
MKTDLKYKTLKQLLDEVSVDFTMYNTEKLMDPAQLIKVAQRVTYDLGLRIHGTKEKVLELSHTKTRLPDDFYILNYAYMCGKFTTMQPRMMGRQTENVIVEGIEGCRKCGSPDLSCCCEATYAVECKTGENIYVQVIEKRVNETRVYDTFRPLSIANSTGQRDALDNNLPSGYIKNGFLYTNVEEGQVFISYQGALENEEGELLVLDHPMINEYYEYAIKQRVLENLFMNGEDVAQKLQLVEQRLRAARNYALTIVNTPDHAEMKELWEMNRRAQYVKYYDMFKGSEFVTWVAPVR